MEYSREVEEWIIANTQDGNDDKNGAFTTSRLDLYLLSMLQEPPG